jgi:formylglycine-generating enzyme required for sulfatase activity
MVADGNYKPPTEPETDPLHLGEDGKYFLFRGGSWNDPMTECTVTFRFKCHEGHRYDYMGFRLAVVAK